jgi:hypothetical protein
MPQEHPTTEEHNMTDVASTVDTYLAAYSEPDSQRRSALIDQAWVPDGRLIDPPMTGEGRGGISEMADALQQQFAGHRFRRVSAIDTHHDQLRFAWELVAPDGTVAVAGLDVGELADDGRLRRITGFFGELTTAGDLNGA